jgi:hypothetical protein
MMLLALLCMKYLQYLKRTGSVLGQKGGSCSLWLCCQITGVFKLLGSRLISRPRWRCQEQLFLRVLTWLEGGQGIIFQIVANVRDPSCIKGLNLAGTAPKESFCQATPPLRYWEMLKTSALSTDSESKSLSLSLKVFSQNGPASLLPHLGAILWYPAGHHVLFPDLSFQQKNPETTYLYIFSTGRYCINILAIQE